MIALVLIVLFYCKFSVSSEYNPNYKQAGIYGGLAAGSTILYYQYMTDVIEPYAHKYEYPELVIYSANWQLVKDLIYETPPKWDKVIDMFVEKFNEMHDLMGCDFGAIACNTVHYVFDEIQARTKMPLVSIVNSTLDNLLKKGHNKTILFGTMSTMTMGYYQKAAQSPPYKGRIDIIVPEEEDREYIDNKIFTELMRGIVKNSTRDGFVKIIEKNLVHGIDSVIIGCTEISLLLSGPTYLGCEMCDSTKSHAVALAEYSMNY